MMKTFLIALLVACVAGAGAYAFIGGKNEMINPNNKKVLIAYYSLSGNTKKIAQRIQEQTGGTLYEIKTTHTYPDEYKAVTEQAKKEIEAGFRPELSGEPVDLTQYDMVFIGSPNWWGTITPVVSSFVEQNDLNGKQVVPFITHGGGGVQNTVKDMTAQCKGCQMQKPWVGYSSMTIGFDSWLEGVMSK